MRTDVDRTLLAEAEDLLPTMTDLRRHLHRRPEIGLHNPRTQEALLESIDGLGLDVRTGTACSGISAVLEGEHDGPTILLRADMDALPMPEDVDLPFRSETGDTMHACGHDLHVSMLSSAARLLHARRGELHGRVLFMFQPGEEGYAGAKVMLDEGLLQHAGDIDRAFAIHVSAIAPTGVVALRGGPMMASSDRLTIVVNGRGGHGSMPHHACDPVPVACEIVQALQTMVTRRIDVFDPGVVTVTRINAGTTFNVIPETAEILGTVRAVSERTRGAILDGIRRVADGIAAAHLCTVDVDLGGESYPVTVNDDHVASEVLRIGGELLGQRAAVRMPAPVMGAEDFSYVLQKVPGAMAFLGATPHGIDPHTVAPNHSNRVRFDEETMQYGAALYAAVALDHLAG